MPAVPTVPAVEVSTDPARLDRDRIHRFLAEESYWSAGVDRATVDRSLDHSLCFGAYLAAQPAPLVGFARVVTDRATFAHLMDVFVVPEHRGQGIATDLMTAVMAHPDLQGLRLFTLGTRDAHGLYARFGFGPVTRPEARMERRRDPDGPNSPDGPNRLDRSA